LSRNATHGRDPRFPHNPADVDLQPTAVGGAWLICATKFWNRIAALARFGANCYPRPPQSIALLNLVKKGRIPRGYLGVALRTVRLPESSGGSPCNTTKDRGIILEVEADGPPTKAGIVIGDILGVFGGTTHFAS